MVRIAFAAIAVAFGAAALGVAPPAHADDPYPNCTAARQNNDCDIPSTSDKYQSKLDSDGDGLGCEC